MTDNYVGSHWRFALTGDIYRVIWQAETPAGLPGVPGNTMLVLTAAPGEHSSWPNQLFLTVPVSLLENSAGQFIHVRAALHDYPDEGPQSTGHFEANV